MLSIQVLPVSADNRFEPFADLVVNSGSAYLNSSGKGIFKLTTRCSRNKSHFLFAVQKGWTQFKFCKIP